MNSSTFVRTFPSARRLALNCGALSRAKVLSSCGGHQYFSFLVALCKLQKSDENLDRILSKKRKGKKDLKDATRQVDRLVRVVFCYFSFTVAVRHFPLLIILNPRVCACVRVCVFLYVRGVFRLH